MSKAIPDSTQNKDWQFIREEDNEYQTFLNVKGEELDIMTFELKVLNRDTISLTLPDARRLCSILQDEILRLSGLGNELGSSKGA